MPTSTREVEQLINDWSNIREDFDRLIPESDREPVVLGQMSGLLQQCIAAGSNISKSEDRSILQWMAREIGDCIYLLTDSRPDTLIQPAANQQNDHSPSATTIRPGRMVPWLPIIVCLLAIAFGIFVTRWYFLDRERTYENRIAEIGSDNQRLTEEQRIKQTEQAKFDSKKRDLEKMLAVTKGLEDRLKAIDGAIRLGDDLLDHVDEAKRFPIAINRCLAFIRDSQLPDGAIRMRADGTVWIQPSISAQAALALVTFHIQIANDEALKKQLELVQMGMNKDREKDLDRVLQWLKWYAKHQDENGKIDQQAGTLDQYTELQKKSATSAPWFLMVAERYHLASGDLPGEVHDKLKPALNSIIARVGKDGLISDPAMQDGQPQRKYLLNALESYAGLQAAIWLDTRLNKADPAVTKAAEEVHKGLKRFWQSGSAMAQASGAFVPFIHGDSFGGIDEASFVRANLAGLAWIEPDNQHLRDRLTKEFKPDRRSVINQVEKLPNHPVEWWLIAASTDPRPEEKARLKNATIREALTFTPNEIYVDRPAIVLLALLTGNQWLFPKIE